MNYNTLIVDGPYLAHRSYDAPYKLTTSTGRDATMIHSFIRSLNALRKQFNPNQIIIAWESPGTPSWRRKIYPAYKRTRGRLDNQYIYQLNDLQKLLHLFGVQQYSSYGNEADDVIATYAKIEKLKNNLIYTCDKDLMQLVTSNCHIYNDRKKDIIEISEVKEKFGIYPQQIPDLLAITGDKSDNIEGIARYGIKKAVKILKKYGYIEHISNKELVNRYRTKLLINKKLTKLNKNCKLESYKFNGNGTIESILNKYQLEKMKEKIDEYKLLGKII